MGSKSQVLGAQTRINSYLDFHFLSLSPSVSVSDIELGTIRLAMLNNFWAGVLDMLIYANTILAESVFA